MKKILIAIIYICLGLSINLYASANLTNYVTSANIQNNFPDQIDKDLTINGTLTATTINATVTGDVNADNITSGTLSNDRLNTTVVTQNYQNTVTINNILVTPTINARNADGLGLYDDSGILGIFIEDGGNVGIATDNPSEELQVNGDILASGGITELGGITGLVIEYNDTTTVNISAGWCEASGNYYQIDSTVTLNVSTLASGFDFHYIYIDDSESTAPTPVFISSTTEPSTANLKNGRGLYNGDDRCIGVVMSPNASATIASFALQELSDKVISYDYDQNSFPVMASNINPDGTWQTPDENDGSVVTPVTATSLTVQIRNGDAANTVYIFITSKEMGDLVTGTGSSGMYTFAYDRIALTYKLILGASRNVYVAGQDDDTNDLDLFARGFDIER